MAKHMGAKGKRQTVAVIAIVLVIAVVGLGAFYFAHSPNGHDAESSASSAPVAADDACDNSANDVTQGSSAKLPFSLQGVSSSADLIEASEITQTATLSDEWTFGGDYALIGSFPIDSKTVFGSSTDDPDDVEGYSAALISPDHSAQLEERQTSDAVFEPQDGTGTSSRIVWRSSELSNLPVTGTDNWRVQLWTPSLDKPIALGSAEALNGTDKTPMLDGEILPTANDSNAFFASMTKSDEAWKPTVVSWALGHSLGATTVIGEGSYPAAISDGCLWAANPDYEDSGTYYHSLSRWNGSSSSDVFSLQSETGTWGISGVWASDVYRVVGFSSDDSSRGSYLGIWNADFSGCLAWVHLNSPRAVASLNNEWLVWGAGSESDNAQMYALRLSDSQASLLGECKGYSRPSIAYDSNVVMVPVSNGMNAVSYRVATIE